MKLAPGLDTCVLDRPLALAGIIDKMYIKAIFGREVCLGVHTRLQVPLFFLEDVGQWRHVQFIYRDTYPLLLGPSDGT